MKKVLLSMMFCFGVGLAMMASPAQGADDDNLGSNEQAVTAVSDRPAAPVHHGRDLIQFKFKVKKNFDYSKLKAPECLQLGLNAIVPTNPNKHGVQSVRTQAEENSKVGKTPWGNNPGSQSSNPNDGGKDPHGNTNDWRNQPVTEGTGHTHPTSTY